MFEGLGIQMVDRRLLKYIPKKLHPYIYELSRYRVSGNTFNYSMSVEINGRDESIEFADSVDELRWNAKQLLNYLVSEHLI